MYEGGAAGDRARFLRRRAGGHAPPGDGRSGMDEAPSGNGRTSVWDDEVADGPAPVPGAWIAKSDGWSTSWECPPCWRHLSPPEPETDFLPSQTMLCSSIGNSPTSHTAWFAGTTKPGLLFAAGSSEDQIGDLSGMRHQRQVTCLQLHGGRIHAFCDKPFQVGIDRLIEFRHRIP